MAAKFTLKTTSNGQHLFILHAANGEIILTSETYTQKQSAEAGIESVRRNAVDDARYERKTSTSGQSFFVLKAANGEPIGSSEMYGSQSGMESGIESVKKNAPGAEIQS
ncbi:MAG TPA: YegP family protein [Abditibacterium sp.]|jgi:hypothetical protein